MRKIILASNSPRRKELLRKCGAQDFTVVPGHAEEAGSTPENFSSVALINACLKAEEVASRYPDSIVIGADTVIEFERECIGKPADLKDAGRILARLSGREHIVSTGVCFRCIEAKLEVRFVDSSIVRFKTLSPEAIQQYLSLVPVLDKAGAYAIQEHGDLIIDSISGSETNIIGFPVERITETLRLLTDL